MKYIYKMLTKIFQLEKILLTYLHTYGTLYQKCKRKEGNDLNLIAPLLKTSKDWGLNVNRGGLVE